MIFFYLLIAVMPLVRHPLWAHIVGEATVFKYLGGLCVAYAAFYVASRKRIPSFLGTWQARFFLLFYLLVLVSHLTHDFPSETLTMSPFVSLTSFLLLFGVTLSVVDSLKRLRRVLFVTIGSVGFASLYVIREWQKYHNLYGGFRPGWVVGDPNYFTAMACLCAPLAFYLLLKRRAPRERQFYLGCLVLTLVAATLGASRGGFLGLATAFLFVIWHSRHRLRNIALVSLLLVPLSLFSSTSPLHRFLAPTRSDQQSSEERLVAWRAGWRMIQAHPWAGVGLGNFKPMMLQYRDPGTNDDTMAHNNYVEIAAELGLPGLAVYLAILVCTYHTLTQVRRTTLRASARLVRHAALGMQASLLGYAVASFFMSAEYIKLFWLIVFLSMCLPSLRRPQAVWVDGVPVEEPADLGDYPALNSTVQETPIESV
jgi:O-antigen ligase